MKIIVTLKSFPDHKGIPGHQGGSLPENVAPGYYYLNDDRTVNADKIAASIKSAIQEHSGRATHGNTATNAFVLIEGKIVPWDKQHEYSMTDRRHAIPVHSHGGENWQEYAAQQGKPIDFQPLNNEDIHIWLDGVKKGYFGMADVIIMPDGRMEIISITSKTNPSIFSMSAKKLDTLLSSSYADHGTYYQAHKNDPNHEPYALERIKLRDFCSTYGLQYSEKLVWDVHK
jgi:hypothetical protein